MNKYLEAEKRLAELLGFTCEFDAKHSGNQNPIWRHAQRTPQFVRGEVPIRWTHDNAAAFALMVEHGCWPYINDILTDRVHVSAPSVRDDGPVCSELVRDHPDKETAVRFAIVMAVITKLEKVT